MWNDSHVPDINVWNIRQGQKCPFRITEVD